jgi:chromosome segregation ATPase
MPPSPSAVSVKNDEQDRRLTALERLAEETAGQLRAVVGELRKHVTECDGRHKGVDQKVDTLQSDLTGVKADMTSVKADMKSVTAETKAQTESLTQIKVALGIQQGGRKMLSVIITLVVVPLLGFLGALLSGKWAGIGGGN